MKASRTIAAIGASAALVFGGLAVTIHDAAEAGAVPGNIAKGVSLANHGLDPVSLFEGSRRIVGLAKYSTIHDGAIHRFASASNLRKFRARPDHYKRLPGGHCAYGVAVGARFFGDPRCFKTVDGGLSLNLDEEVQETPPQRARGLTREIIRNWTQIKHKDPSDLG